MSTYNWSVPTGNIITGSTYIKDTDNKIQDTMDDLADFVNSLGVYAGQGLMFDYVDKANNQTITGNKTFSGVVILPSTTSIGTTSGTELGYIDGVTSSIQTQLDSKVSKITSTDNVVVRFDGTTGVIQNSSVLIDDSGSILAKDLSYKNSLITINSWSYSGTTITLNVTSHTYLATEYIETSGLTSTTNAPNGIYLVTSVTTSTIVFTAYAAPTGTTGVSTARVKGYVTINGRISDSLGINQALQDVTSSRILGTTYTNTTGKPIYVMAVLSTSSTTAGTTITINGIGFFTNINGTTTGANVMVYGVIPPSGTYSVSTASGTLVKWGELR